MRSVLLIILITITSCSIKNTKQENQDVAQNIALDSIGERQMGTSDNHESTKEFIRPAYFSRLNNKEVNSWQGKSDVTGIYSAKIICNKKRNKSFSIYNKSGEVVQSDELKDLNSDCDHEFKYSFIDMNFDGNLDFKVNLELGASNSYDEYWLYVPSDKKFHFSDELSMLISAIPYPTENRIESYFSSGMDAQNLKDYMWDQGKLKLIREESVDAKREGAKHIINIRQNEKMVKLVSDNNVVSIRN